MIDKEKLIGELENKVNRKIFYANVQSLINELKSGYYDTKGCHDVDEYYQDDEDVWCK